MKDRNSVTYEYRQINTKDLMVDDFYQREIDSKRLMRMVKNYDPCLVNPIKVSFRDNKYWIFDGQHTSVLEKTMRGKGRDVLVDCKVFCGLTRIDEMELFIKQNGDSSPVKTAAKLRALYNAGDPDVVGMVKDTEIAGVRIDPNFTLGRANSKINAYSTIQRIYMRFKAKNKIGDYIDMLNVINVAWDGSPDAFVTEILSGMARFYEVHAGQFSSKDLIKSLRRISPIQIVRDGKGSLSGRTTANGYARCIAQAYNNKRKNRLEDKL